MIRLLMIGVLLTACAGQGAHSPRSASRRAIARAVEEDAVLAVVDRFFRAMESKDTTAFRELMTEDGISYVQALRDGRWRVFSRTNREFADGLADSDAVWSERYWQPTVLVRGPIAVVWTPYEFRVDGAVSHCGVDVFNLVQVGGRWRIGTAMWTIEPEACPELRPIDPATIDQGVRRPLRDD